MEKINAEVTERDDKHFLTLFIDNSEISIQLTGDNPNEIKSAFNHIITRLKTGIFQVELDSLNEDLFSQIAKEYISQLNTDISDVYKEMQELGLTVDATATAPDF